MANKQLVSNLMLEVLIFHCLVNMKFRKEERILSQGQKQTSDLKTGQKRCNWGSFMFSSFLAKEQS